MKKILAFLLIAMLAVCSVVPAFAADYNIDTARASVVRILVQWTIEPNNLGWTGYGSSRGSGFCIGDPNDDSVQYVVTNGHVVCRNLGSGSMRVDTVGLQNANGGIDYVPVHVDGIYVILTDLASGSVVANLEGVSDRADVAVIKLNTPTNLRKAAVFVDWKEKDFETRTPLNAMGFPSSAQANQLGEVQDQLVSNTNNVIVNHGFFSSWDPNSLTGAGDQIHTTAEMDHGISGGPLVNDEGYVVGVCYGGAIASANVNYAVATDEILMLLQTLTEAKYVVGPLKSPISTTLIIIIAAAVAAIGVLVGLILASGSKKNNRTMVFGGSMAGKSVALKKGTPVVVGRDPNRCQVVYPKDAAGVSSVHCTITFDGKEVTVADNGSSYGTFVGGAKVEPGKPVVMHRGQEVTFGSDKNTAELH